MSGFQVLHQIASPWEIHISIYEGIGQMKLLLRARFRNSTCDDVCNNVPGLNPRKE
jgi:hypothetical protein